MSFRLCIIAAILCLASNNLPAQYCAEIPYTVVGGKLTVDVVLNGRPGHFIFDTGAPVCLTHTFSQGLELPFLGTVPMMDSNGNIFESPVVEVGTLFVGGVTFTQPQALIMEEGNIVEQFGVDGIVGYTLFSDKVVRIDSRRKIITITGDASRFDLDAETAIPLLSCVSAPYFEVNLNGQADTVMLDTGAGGFYDLSARTYDRLRDSGAWDLLSRGRGSLSLSAAGLEPASLKYRVCIPRFSVGDALFTRVTATTTTGYDSRLGGAFLATGIVTIDYPNARLYYEPYADRPVDRYVKEWNVVVTAADGMLKAGFVWESMWDRLDGGEKVVEINGRRFDKVDAWEAMTTNLAGLSGDEAEIVVLDKSGNEKKLKIRRE